MKKHLHTAVLTLILTAALLLCACAGGSFRNDLTAADVADKLTAALPQTGRHAVADDYISYSAFGEDKDLLLEKTDSHVILIADNSDMNIDEIGVFHVTSASDVAAVRALLEEYTAAQALRWKDLLVGYNPGESPKLDHAGVKVCGQYVLYTVLSGADTETAQSEFEKLLKAE